jgi:NitT/TauT family transport system substrate-binding protein
VPPSARSRVVSLLGSILALVLASAPSPGAEKAGIAVLPLISSAPVFLAQSRGFFAAEGLEIELHFFQAAQPVALAVASGDVEFGVTGLTAGFYNLAGRGALEIIAGQARVEPGDEFIAYVAGAKAWQAGLRNLDALPGHSVGITQTGSTFHYMVGRLADKRGFALERVKLVTLETLPNVVAALRGGRIDAALLPGHLARPLVEEGIANLLGWAGDETPWQLGAVFATPRTLERRAATVEAFLRAYRRGAAVYDDALRPVRAGASPDAAAKEKARALAEELRRFVPASVEEILASAPMIDRDGRLEVADVREQVAWFQRHGMVDRTVKPDDLLAPQARDLTER